ncbi:glutaminyl-peptide cyclotransferase [Fundidesulfovibrio agrisoli]|uniref:glutaminyl-peptide cyclotransferase n=1 Tax=Fundidesulfovibrio agrisoli TaxID=2922717 RepID=UPI001FAE4744|nr:glutaminyl-peptide cyclotransferase [Fundidesulfovibrio agrisoli]
MKKFHAMFRAVRLSLPVLLALALLAAPCSAGNLTYSVTAVLPHDPQAFTQGLVFSQGYFYESTGLNGRSSLRKVEPATGRVVQKRDLPAKDFGEGLALVGADLIQLTWTTGKAYVYDAASFQPKAELPLDTQGWGAAATPFGLLTSDGSDTLTWRDPASMKPVRTLRVADGQKPVTELNELEWVDGWILANVWHDDRIAVVSPATGKVAAWIDCAQLRARTQGLPDESDLNGIAWDPATRRLFVTGKLWPSIYVLSLEGLPKP